MASSSSESRDSYLLELSNNIPSSTTASDPDVVETDVQFGGRVTAVTLGWLDGANGQAGVRIVDETGHTYIPYNTQDLDNEGLFIASNDFTQRFDVEFEVDENETLAAEFINVDGSNSHLINVFVTVQRGD